jgi:hypothetical protein
MSNDKIKTVTMNANTLNDVFEDLNFLSKLMDDLISDLHNVKGGQQARHSYMLYREYMWGRVVDSKMCRLTGLRDLNKI